MRVIVVGCGQVGAALAHQLYRKGHEVTVIDKNAAAFENLPFDFRGRTVTGDVLAREALYRAEIDDMDALAAVTNHDALNALVAHIARTEFKIAKVIARNYDPRKYPLQAAFDIPIVSSAVLGAQHIEEFLSDNPVRLAHHDPTANIGLYHFEIPESWRQRALQELLPENWRKVLAVSRAGEALPVSGGLSLEAGDVIILNANPQEITRLEQQLTTAQEQSL